MRRIRTISKSIYPGRITGCLLAFMLAVAGTSALAQDQDKDAEPAPSASTEVRGVVSSGQGEWGLSQRFPDSALWLELEDGTRTLALFWPEMETPARGAVIILADEGENAESGLAGALARELTHRKLAVLSLGLETPPAALKRILERPQLAPEAKPEGQSPEAAIPTTIDVMAVEAPGDQETAYRERIRDELAAGAAELNTREYELVALVGIGRGSNHVVSYAAGLGTPPALIWAGPKFYPGDAERLAPTLEKASVPRILELSSSGEGSDRRASLARAGVQGFSLQPVGSGTGFVPRDGKALAGRIAAWLAPDARQ
ncbi:MULTISPECIES: DUF3530 family protein [Marinobacter]|uniref:DUF3530 family protein n=1 Tax=Marinobacter xiaoshiensis TaxID=3073652 RepID=A0ABU2HJ35_9GAMM|nr:MULTISPECIES: DUF3530 family protein [unclassified Marinobacter]MBK1873098.1 DUF3530 family protein [Marinobacter sp. 1-3A]MBK1886333.1 DUF3530 family protein [Marinobacter sp. DY40_1A1]MDS1311069.1 DUF3530 family protein [Marinobacter sp. F60267]